MTPRKTENVDARTGGALELHEGTRYPAFHEMELASVLMALLDPESQPGRPPLLSKADDQ